MWGTPSSFLCWVFLLINTILLHLFSYFNFSHQHFELTTQVLYKLLRGYEQYCILNFGFHLLTASTVGTLAHELTMSFHDKGCKPHWTRTESKPMVRFTVDLMGKFDSALVQFSLQPELWRELSTWTKVPLFTEMQLLSVGNLALISFRSFLVDSLQSSR